MFHDKYVDSKAAISGIDCFLVVNGKKTVLQSILWKVTRYIQIFIAREKIKSVVKKCLSWLIDALKTSIFVVNGQLRENPEVIADKFKNFFTNVRVTLASKMLASNTSFQSFYKGSQCSINISFTCEH